MRAGTTHTAPKARTATTATFSLPPICNDQTSDTGKRAKIKSPTQLIAEEESAGDFDNDESHPKNAFVRREDAEPK